MGGKPKPELLDIPGAEGLSVDYFTNLMSQTLQGQNIPQLQVGPAQRIPGLQVGPAQQIAGMTGTEQTVQGLLGKYLGTSAAGGEAYKLGMGELQKTLGGEFYDPRTSDFWGGYREVSEMEQEKGVADIRRRGQLGGGLYATPGQRVEAEYEKGMGAQRLGMLGGLYETERQRQAGAVGQALGYAGLEEQGAASRIGLGAEVGAIPRQIQSQQYQAAYIQQEKKSQAAYAQQFGQSQADFARQQAQHQATYQQQLGQEQSDYATQLAQIGIQGGAAEQLMPQWYVPGGDGGAGALGLFGTIASALIGK